ncbi:MAG: hypothetical protein H6Q48_1416 [Deltaproteobacteria bacterium]|nr:hypothetical protein [Deltaproteobacteria bacterium]
MGWAPAGRLKFRCRFKSGLGRPAPQQTAPKKFCLKSRRAGWSLSASAPPTSNRRRRMPQVPPCGTLLQPQGSLREPPLKRPSGLAPNSERAFLLFTPNSSQVLVVAMFTLRSLGARGPMRFTLSLSCSPQRRDAGGYAVLMRLRRLAVPKEVLHICQISDMLNSEKNGG